MKKGIAGILFSVVLVITLIVVPAVAATVVATDDFNRADGNLGSNWIYGSGDQMVISGNRAQAGGFGTVYSATYNGVTGNIVEGDIYHVGSPGGRIGFVMDYLDKSNNILIFVEDYYSGSEDTGFDYMRVLDGFPGAYGGVELNTWTYTSAPPAGFGDPFTSAHMKVELVSGVLSITFSNINPGGGTRTYSLDVSSSLPTGGTGVGIVGYGDPQIDDFSISFSELILQYDDGSAEQGSSLNPNFSAAVLFTPPVTPVKLTAIEFYPMLVAGYVSEKLTINVYDAGKNVIFSTNTTEGEWVSHNWTRIDLSSGNITVSGNFSLALQWGDRYPTPRNPALGQDNDGVSANRSYMIWPAGSWSPLTYNWFIRAVVEPAESAPIAVEVSVDIKPESCPNPLNVRSKGVVSVAILGTEDFDVTEVDPASVRLEGVAPLRWSWEDVATPFEGELCDCHELGADGYSDLILKFDTPEVVAALGAPSDGDVLTLMLTGNLKAEFDSTPIEGADCVVIKAR